MHRRELELLIAIPAGPTEGGADPVGHLSPLRYSSS
jgi:hypothetical protein